LEYVHQQEVTNMIKKIRFLPTGEVRPPKIGDWFLGALNRPICAAQNFLTTKFHILRMVVEEEEAPRPMAMADNSHLQTKGP
jgi:hypothetical protein